MTVGEAVELLDSIEFAEAKLAELRSACTGDHEKAFRNIQYALDSCASLVLSLGIHVSEVTGGSD